MIKIKNRFNGFMEVSKEVAADFILWKFSNIRFKGDDTTGEICKRRIDAAFEYLDDSCGTLEELTYIEGVKSAICKY